MSVRFSNFTGYQICKNQNKGVINVSIWYHRGFCVFYTIEELRNRWVYSKNLCQLKSWVVLSSACILCQHNFPTLSINQFFCHLVTSKHERNQMENPSCYFEASIWYVNKQIYLAIIGYEMYYVPYKTIVDYSHDEYSAVSASFR